MGQNTALTQRKAVVNSQSAPLGQMQQQNRALQATLGCMSRTGDGGYFTRCNVRVVSGSGATDGALNGLGNLIIGYNEDAAAIVPNWSPSIGSGSHNLVVGAGHSYTAMAGSSRDD